MSGQSKRQESLHVQSKITSKNQITVPSEARRWLNASTGDSLRFVRYADGRVLVELASPEPSDPALEPFLALLAEDIEARPERLVEVTPADRRRIRHLVEAAGDVDLDADLGDLDDDC